MSDAAKRARIEEEASVWTARLAGGDMDEADHAALQHWLNSDPEHHRAFAGYRRMEAQIEAGLKSRELRVERPAPRRDGAWRLWTPVLAAAAGVVFVLTLFGGRAERIETGLAERRVVMLADGSKLELNALTSLTVKLGQSERRVRLLHGEVLFTVAKDPARPLFVETPGGVVRVIGTVFNIRAAADDRVEITVLEGTVRLRVREAKADEAALAADSQAVIAAGHVSVRTIDAVETQNAVAWRTGQVVFVNTPLADAVERFAAYHARTITVDPGAADLRLGGRYSLDDLDGLFIALERVLPARVMRLPSGDVRIVATTPRAR